MKSCIATGRPDYIPMETETKSAAFFDMDGTLLHGESQFAFLLCCLRRGVAPPFRSLLVAAKYASYLLGLSQNAKQLRASGFALFAGVSVQRLETMGAEFFDFKLAHRIRRQSVALVAAHQKCGHTTVLVTSACELVARPFAARFGFDAIIATRLLTRDGFYTGERELPEPYGAGKRQIVERFCEQHSISPSESFAYTDHHTDLSLLEFVGHPIAVNPTRKLQAIAATKKWPTMDLDSLAMPTLAFPDIVH
jgi:putative phosphoserine phosphatase/1-acylglycerol-3-phosphate O-acyltransferase